MNDPRLYRQVVLASPKAATTTTTMNPNFDVTLPSRRRLRLVCMPLLEKVCLVPIPSTCLCQAVVRYYPCVQISTTKKQKATMKTTTKVFLFKGVFLLQRLSSQWMKTVFAPVRLPQRAKRSFRCPAVLQHRHQCYCGRVQRAKLLRKQQMQLLLTIIDEDQL